MTDIDTLIRDLEAAPGATREMDVRIEVTRRAFLHGLGAAAIASQLARIKGIGIGKFAKAEEVPFYTSSIDAALTLVPEPHDFSIQHSPWSAIVNKKRGWGRTPALALCIAALKARSAS